MIEAAVNARNVPVRSSHIIRSQTHIDVSLIGETPLRTKNPSKMNDAQYIISLNQNKLKEDGNRRSSVQVMTTGKTTQVMTTEKTMESINDIYNGGLSTME